MRRSAMPFVLCAQLVGCGRVAFDAMTDAAPLELDSAPSAPVTSQLTIAAPPAPLADIVFLVVLDDTRAARDVLGDASTLRFIDESGTVLPHEIEFHGAAGGPPLVAWVRVPLISAAVTIKIEYGANVPAPSALPVWTTDYAAVWHLGGNGTAVDSSSFHRDATTVGAVEGTGFAAGGRNLMTNEYLNLATTLSLTGFTVSGFASFRTFGTGGSFQGMITRQFGTGGDNDIYLGVMDNHAVLTCETASGEHDAVGATPLTPSTFHYFTGVATATDGRIFVDGARDNTVTTGQPLTSSTHTIFLGGDRSDTSTAENVPTGNYVDGIIDEIRLQTVARSDAWVAYDAMAARGDAITYGPVIRP